MSFVLAGPLGRGTGRNNSTLLGQIMAYRIQVVWANGEIEYVRDASDKPSEFPSRAVAKEWADGIQMGMDDDEYQSVSIVKAPRKKSKTFG